MRAFAAACLLAGLAPCTAAAQGGKALTLTIEEAIFLALKNSRTAIAARLGRDEQALALEAAEERYDPKAGDFGLSISERSGSEKTGSVSLGPSLRVPTGGNFRLSWSKPVAGPGDRSGTTSLTFSQPLLKGFGPDIDTWTLRSARLAERINVRAFRDRVSGIVGSVIGAYRGVLSAERRLTIAREALQRAERQLEINRALVEAGRMAPRDLVQTESTVANRQYSLTDAEVALDNANSGLINTLDLEEGVRVVPSEEPPVEPETPDLEESMETAFARRTDWLSAEIGLKTARMAQRIAVDNLLPNLSLDTAAQRSGESDPVYSARVNLTVPLWDAGPRRALAKARNDVRRAKMALAERRQSIRIEVRRAVHNVAVALRRIDLAGDARDLAERTLEVERLKLQQGLSSSFQVGRFEDDLVNAQRQELSAVVGYRSALDSLSRTLGTTLDRWGIEIEQVGR